MANFEVQKKDFERLVGDTYAAGNLRRDRLDNCVTNK
jgi:hypothetical protein